MKDFSHTYEVFSPRWGHTDGYAVTITQNGVRIVLQAGSRVAECRKGDNGDPEWTGSMQGSDNPLMQIFGNDSIYAPDVVPFAIEWAWEQWRESRVSEAEFASGMQELFAWIDATARGKPSGVLWRGGF